MRGLIQAKVVSQERIGRDIFKLTIDAGHIDAIPGQFINLFMDDQAHILPRPISVCDITDEGIVLVYRVAGIGTESFSRLSAGDEINALGFSKCPRSCSRGRNRHTPHALPCQAA